MITLNHQYSSSSIAQRVFARQVSLLYEKMTGAVISTLLVVILMFGFFSQSAQWSILAPWLFSFLAILLYRSLTLLYFHWQKKQSRFNSSTRTLAYIYLSGVILTGCIWGAMVIWLMPEMDFKGQVLLFVIIMGMSSGAIPTMSYLKAPITIFILLLILPLIYITYAMHVPNALPVAITMIVYTTFMLRTAITFFNSTKDMLVLQEKAIDHEYEMLLQREQALQANNTKSEFLSRMSHELRTPLNAVIGLNELMQVNTAEPLTEKQLSRSRKIHEAAQHLLNLVNDVLDLSRIETGDIDIRIEPVEGIAMVHDVLTLAESKIRSNALRVDVGTMPETLWLQADRVRLKQVLFNLIDNAIKYNRKEGMIGIEIAEVDGGFWRIAVLDTGYGLSKDDIQQLFVPFARLSAERLGIDGTGIGLSYSKQLVELMGGRIGVESREGEGSCFWFELPEAQFEPDVSAQRVENTPEIGHGGGSIAKNNRPIIMNKAESPMQVGDQALVPLQILLVEDNLVNQEVVVDMLDMPGYRVDIAVNGREAVAACREQRYDLVLMDCEMPVMDGLAATRKIREQEVAQEKAAVPIVALTAHAISGAREKCLKTGMNDFLSKPFSYAELHKLVEKWTGFVHRQASGSGGVDGQASAETDNAINTPEQEIDLTMEPVIDMVTIDRLRQAHKKSSGDSAKATAKKPLLERVLGLYLEQTPPLLEKMAAAVTDNNVGDIVDIAHTLKSSSAAVGALTMSERCREIELAGREKQLDMTKTKQKVSEIHHIYQRVEDKLNEILIG